MDGMPISFGWSCSGLSSFIQFLIFGKKPTLSSCQSEGMSISRSDSHSGLSFYI
jgi:hypothetical protein